MTNEAIIEAVAALRARIPFKAMLRPERIDPLLDLDPFEPSTEDRLLALKHLLFMCEEIPRMVAAAGDGKQDKAFRWLGFLQGAVWALGLSNLEDLKRMNSDEASA